MTFPAAAQFLLDDEVLFPYGSEDFDLDFDVDYEFISDEEFEVSIDYDDEESDEQEISGGEICMDDLDGFGDFDAAADSMLADKDYDEIE